MEVSEPGDSIIINSHTRATVYYTLARMYPSSNIWNHDSRNPYPGTRVVATNRGTFKTHVALQRKGVRQIASLKLMSHMAGTPGYPLSPSLRDKFIRDSAYNSVVISRDKKRHFGSILMRARAVVSVRNY
eukprot:739051-Rhodomonas_salina.1